MKQLMKKLGFGLLCVTVLSACVTKTIEPLPKVQYTSNTTYNLPVRDIEIKSYQEKYILRHLPISLSDNVYDWTKTYLKSGGDNGTAFITIKEAQLGYEPVTNHDYIAGKITSSISVEMVVKFSSDDGKFNTHTIRVQSGGYKELSKRASLVERNKIANDLMNATLRRMDNDLRKKLQIRFPQ